MDLGIRGRNGIVNGGSAGMGKAAAFALAREGVDLVISARGEARLRATAAEITAATGVRVTPWWRTIPVPKGWHVFLRPLRPRTSWWEPVRRRR